ncbi:hypothetical protein S7711_10495 [Stachybotrys chartarum IBT 7711]|uniref:CBM1 domain-containing protein n=1 Tax=Stachybotrys chartarum (strain CBS 109288 / IBT 7711) TaxID=1280523 RepID=A0A084BCC0_STACB|nr:hypothetical protein S7711_10495 [Stachybotrys chartarum IBT 7711]
MRVSLVSAAAVLALSHGASAQQPPYGWCGGKGWTGPTECIPPYVCRVLNEWMSQCDLPRNIPGWTTSVVPTATAVAKL